MGKSNRKSALMLAGSLLTLIGVPASAASFNIPGGTLSAALDAYSAQSGVPVAIATKSLGDAQTKGVVGEMSADQALTKILSGTGFSVRRVGSSVAIVRGQSSENTAYPVENILIAQATPPRSAVETVTVTSSKLGGGDVQSIPISITALSQEQLTATQTAGGPDLIKQVPNMTFTKTNFSGYSIQLRGIGTQAISVTTDPAVAVALNDIPFIRNHFFEQEFYDLSQAEVLRGPQGTLYGRNATAGVVNLITAKPTDQFEAMASADIGNYHNRRLEGMINIPIVNDQLDLRVAGEWTKRQGYSFNEIRDQRTDGRDLWSGRVSLAWKPIEDVQATLVWEHFSEDDDRMRTSKQLCKTSPSPTEVGGVPITRTTGQNRVIDPNSYLNQGCEMSSLYSLDTFEVPNGNSLGYYQGIAQLGAPVQGGGLNDFDPYASTTQSRNLRIIQTEINPIYKAKNDTLELDAEYKATPTLTFVSQTGFNNDFLWSTEDYNRFDTVPGAFQYATPNDFNGSNQFYLLTPDPNGLGHCRFGYSNGCESLPANAVCKPPSGAYQDTASDPANEGNPYSCVPDGVFCDPQLGCSDRLVAEDLSEERSWQFSQEFRLASNFSGPLNFSVGGNFLHYETEENYYVFINTLTMVSAGDTYGAGPGGSGRAVELPWLPGISDNANCIPGGFIESNPFVPHNPQTPACIYIDPNPLTSLNNEGHNYFLSQNPYTLNSYASFGELYYNILPDLKLIGGLRWTEDQKHFVDIPSELLVAGWGYPTTGVVDQQWDQFTGRAVANWTPNLSFTDQTLFYASYSHGYKGGGANPPGAVLLDDNTGGEDGQVTNPIHPLTFKPEFVDAFELGTKNTLLDGALTLNGDLFYYNYENYQISEIVDRTSINLNFDTHVKGAEVEVNYEPVPGLRFNFAGGWEDARLAKGSRSVDLMDRTAGNPDWIVVKPFVTQASNCILPVSVVAEMLLYDSTLVAHACDRAYGAHQDPVTQQTYTGSPVDASGNPFPSNYPGFDPTTAPNNGAGFDKDLSGNQLPNAPPLTVSLGAQYTLPITPDWAGTLRGDYYWQDYSWARVFNDRPYDRIRGYTNVNLTLIFTNQNGWQVMLYDKNIFNETAITGDFLNSDDSGLTTNVFLTDPKLIGIRVTKNW